MANGYVDAVDPFRQAFGARLALLDISAAIAVPLLVRDALVNRRRVGRHSAAMLATVLFILPPMFGLFPLVPGFPPGFTPACYAGELLGAAIAGWLWLRDRRDGAPFLVVALLDLAQCVSLAFYDGHALARAVATLSPLPTAALMAGMSVLLLTSGGKPAARGARPAPAASRAIDRGEQASFSWLAGHPRPTCGRSASSDCQPASDVR